MAKKKADYLVTLVWYDNESQSPLHFVKYEHTENCVRQKVVDLKYVYCILLTF
jgi:hypothetical protein